MAPASSTAAHAFSCPRWAAIAFAALNAFGVACTDEKRDSQASSACENVGCTPGGSGKPGSGSGGSGSTGTGTAAAGDVVGSVVALADPTLSQSIVYAGATTVEARDALTLETLASATLTSGSSSFALVDVPGGAFWGRVQDDEQGATGVMTTFSTQVAPSDPAAFAVLQRDVLTGIAANLSPPASVDADRAHIVIEVVRSGAALPGVSVLTGSASGALVAYDDQSTTFSLDFEATGQFGRVLLLNYPASGTPDLALVDLLDADGVTYTVTVPVEANAFTFAGFVL